MIVTVTPSPGLDLTYHLDLALDPLEGEVIRARESGLEASGKGVNVSRALAAAGVPTIAVLPVGGSLGRHLLDLLDAEGVLHRAVETAAPTRVNTSVLQPGGRTTKVNAPSPRLSPAEADGLVAAAAAALDACAAATGGEHWLAVCGSVPEPAAGLVGRLVIAARAAGARCAVDASGGALTGAVAAGADLLAPNLAELAELVGGSGAGLRPDRPEDVAAAAAEVARMTGGELLVSLGEHGALWTDGYQARHAAGPAAVPVNTAGAGDALLSGWLAGPVPTRGAREDDTAARLARAAAWGTATVLSPTTVADAARLRDADDSGANAVHVRPVAWAGNGNDRFVRQSSPGTRPGGD